MSKSPGRLLSKVPHISLPEVAWRALSLSLAGGDEQTVGPALTLVAQPVEVTGTSAVQGAVHLATESDTAGVSLTPRANTSSDEDENASQPVRLDLACSQHMWNSLHLRFDILTHISHVL